MQTKIQLFNREQQTESFAAGETVFRAGEPGDCMFVVVAGAVDIVVNEHVIESLGTGDAFGEMALIEESSRSASAIARTDATLVRIDKRRFMFLVQQNPYFALQLMTIMSQRLRRMVASL